MEASVNEEHMKRSWKNARWETIEPARMKVERPRVASSQLQMADCTGGATGTV